MNRKLFSAAVLLTLFSFCCWASPPAIAQEERFEDVIRAKQEAIDNAEDPKEKAILHKELGDLLISKDEVNKAADEFLQALSLYRGFSEDERLQMAIYISWADKFDEAIKELNAILSENPENLKAQVQLARTLSWAGKNEEAIRLADDILKESPDNRDALLIKANATSWKGNPREAIPIYEKLLAEEEDFDARLGLAHAYLAIGKREAALENSRLLESVYPYQERERDKLADALQKATHSDVMTQFSHYHDSDGNDVNKYTALCNFWIYNLKADVLYTHTDAEDDDGRDNSAEEAWANLYYRVTGSLGIGAGVGVAHAGDGDSDTFGTWNARADLDVYNGALGASVSRSLFSETAEIIDNQIMVTIANAYFFQNLTDRWFSSASYTFRDYSDDNHSNDAQFLVRYAVLPQNPRVTLGYRFRYLNFERQTHHGYFDPNDFIANHLVASLYYERGKFYSYLEPYIGYHIFRRYGDSSDDLVGGGAGSVGVWLTKNLSAEAYAEGGSFSVEAAGGFNYYLVGARLKLLF